MSHPNLEDPLDQKVADHFKNSPEDAINTAKQWTLQYANN
jgi:ubiquitin-conjugating enzyme E2 N